MTPEHIVLQGLKKIKPQEKTDTPLQVDEEKANGQ